MDAAPCTRDSGNRFLFLHVPRPSTAGPCVPGRGSTKITDDCRVRLRRSPSRPRFAFGLESERVAVIVFCGRAAPTRISGVRQACASRRLCDLPTRRRRSDGGRAGPFGLTALVAGIGQPGRRRGPSGCDPRSAPDEQLRHPKALRKLRGPGSRPCSATSSRSETLASRYRSWRFSSMCQGE